MAEHYMTRIKEMGELEDGWWGPGSKAVPSSVLAVLGKALYFVHEVSPIDFGIGPFDESVVLEFGQGHLDHTVEVRTDEIIWTWDWETEENSALGEIVKSPYTAEDLACIVFDIRRGLTLEWLIANSVEDTDD